ncbi:MAG: hypothetical protein CMJ19_21185 [Phycisphaeraceae bacterium]|nr:hypothetical protein [Phycisphaeraceae bacterium]
MKKAVHVLATIVFLVMLLWELPISFVMVADEALPHEVSRLVIVGIITAIALVFYLKTKPKGSK